MNAQETFAKTIKERLLAAGYSYKKFGDEIGSIPHQTVSRWVNGQGLPEFERLSPIARVLNVDYDLIYNLWVAAVSERGRRVAGEPIGPSTSQLHEDIPNTRSEIEEIKKRMERLEKEFRGLRGKSE